MNYLLSMSKKSMLFSVRDPGFLFWCLAYPILLMTIFYMVFSGIKIGEAEAINIGYEKGSWASAIAGEVDFVHGQEMTADEGKRQLEKGNITGFFSADGTLVLSKQGVEETTLKSLANTEKKVETVAQLGGDMRKLDFDTSYVKSVKQKSNPFDITYFSLLAMVSIYAYFGSVTLVHGVLPKSSTTGQRISVSPVRKISILSSGIVATIISNLVANVLLILYMKYVLNMGIIKDIPSTMVLILAGNIFGAALGVIVSAVSSAPEGVKAGIGVGISLTLAFCSGMMSPQVKASLDETVPWLNQFNPVSVITDNLYRVNMLDTYTTYLPDVLKVVFSGALLLVIASTILRRRQYDSI